MISSCMNDRARLASHEHALSARLTTEWTDNQVDVYTLDDQDMTALWVSMQVSNGKTNQEIVAHYEDLTGDQSLTLEEQALEVVSLYAATAINAGRDGRVLTALAVDMQRSGNVLGRIAIRPHNGRNYIVFKGNHRLRQIIRGTRYRLSSPAVIKMGIGTDGLKVAAKGGAYVTLIVSASVNTYAWIFDESFGWPDFLSNLSTDLVKAAIAIVLGYLVAKKVTVATGMVVVANTVGFMVGVIFGIRVARVTWSDVSDFAQQVVQDYSQAVISISSPSQFLAVQKQKINDYAYCTVDAVGSTIIDAVQREVEARVSRYLRHLSPLNFR